jgi:hypothetical protein
MGINGSESTFNEAALKMKRIHDSQELINSLMINLLSYNNVAGKYNYEIVCSEYLNLLNEVFGKLSDKERKESLKWRTCLIEFLETKPVFTMVKEDTFDGPRRANKLDKNNWDFIRKFLFDFGDKVRVYLEEHGYSSPNKDEAAGWD